jgi:glycosyltransferase involved in cell wall biosynthesis
MLKVRGVLSVCEPLFDDNDLKYRYSTGSYPKIKVVKRYMSRIYSVLRTKSGSIIWVEKEMFPFVPAWFERLLLYRFKCVYDFDDAVYLNYAAQKNWICRKILIKKFNKTVPKARVVFCGNQNLASWFRSVGVKSLIVVPSSVDISKYRLKPISSPPNHKQCPIVVWIGSPSTVKYLYDIEGVLQEVYKKSRFIMRVVGATFKCQGLEVDLVEWSDKTEIESLIECDIGIMPLRDTEWENGKCGYKLIQYMACGLPTIASPIGVNRQIVVEGVTGYFASTAGEWSEALEKLIKCDDEIRCSLGKAGRSVVEKKYTTQVNCSLIYENLLSVQDA